MTTPTSTCSSFPPFPAAQSRVSTGHVVPGAPAARPTVRSCDESAADQSVSTSGVLNEPGGHGATSPGFLSARPGQINLNASGTAPSTLAPASTQPELRAGTSEGQASSAPSGPIGVFTVSATTTATSAATSTNITPPTGETASAKPALASPTRKVELPESAQAGSEQERTRLAAAHYKRGFSLFAGLDGSRNAKGAVESYVKAVALGNVHAKSALAIMYLNGDGVNRNVEEALKLLLEASCQGDKNASYNLAVMYDEGRGVPKDTKKAFVLYENAATQGHSRAQDALATLYLDGEAVPRNEKKAVELYKKAVLQGLPQAEYNLGYCYECGYGVGKNIETAAEWYGKAAEQGHIKSQCVLADHLRHGRDGLPQNLARAFALYKMAAEQGNTDAQVNLSLMYGLGMGVARDLASQILWLAKACEARDPRALCQMGVLMMNGGDVQKNEKQAARLFGMAAEDGYDEAQYNFALCHANGDGAEKNYALAEKWFQKAAQQGHGKARKALEWFSSREKSE